MSNSSGSQFHLFCQSLCADCFILFNNPQTSEFRCLRIIKENEAISTKTLAKQMKLTPGRITHLLNSLEFKNLISRQIDKNDRRGIQTYITPDAISFIDKVINEYTKLHEEILEYLPDGKRDEILENVAIFFDLWINYEYWKIYNRCSGNLRVRT